MSPIWESPPADVFKVFQGSVHVWRLKVKAGHPWKTYLNDEEKVRSSRYHFEADRERFSITRGCLRYLLGRYLSRNPLEIELRTDEKGKPRLEESGSKTLSFNVSHSGEAALIALSWNIPVGVDVEKIRDDFPDEKIANRFFSESEKSFLSQLTVSERKRAFFDLWTLKEAFFKAKGEGLLLPLNRFQILSLTVNQPQIVDKDEKENLSRWSLARLPEPQGDHLGALAWEGEGFKVECFDGNDLLLTGP